MERANSVMLAFPPIQKQITPWRPTLYPTLPSAFVNRSTSLLFLLGTAILGFPLLCATPILAVFSIFDRLDIITSTIKASPVGTTALYGYSLLLTVLWATLIIPDQLPFHRVVHVFTSRYRYHRSHISHMRIDRFHRLITSKKPFTIFIVPPSGPTIPMLVEMDTYVHELVVKLIRRAVIPSTPIGVYLEMSGSPGRLKPHQTLLEVSVHPLSHIYIRCPLLGGANGECAVNDDGSLKDASEIQWDYDKDDEDVIPLASGSTGRRQRTRNKARMDEILEAEREPEEGKRKRRKRRGRNIQNPTQNESDPDDSAFTISGPEELSDEDEDNAMEISNEELAESLPSKTIPSKAKGKQPQRPKKRLRKDQELEAPLPPITQSNKAPPPKKKGGIKRNPVYYFYEEVDVNSRGEAGSPGDKHYRCFHGSRKTFTITKAMNYSLNGLVNHLKNHFRPMHQLYLVMKDHNEPTEDEILFANGKKTFDASIQAEYLQRLEDKSSGIREAFAKQQAAAMEPWDQKKFEDLLIRWIVACDQPFDEVEKPEFVDLMNYGCRTVPNFSLPKQDGIRRRIMKLGEDTIGEIKSIFAELESKVSLSLDAWTSSNHHAFIAIVAHYVNNDGEAEELLIDFQELIGQHSGENMAAVVWSTMEVFGITDKVVAVVMDNASNNNTLMDSIEKRCREAGIDFSAKRSRMRCMPHTIHLAAMKARIGVFSKSDGQKKSYDNYQDDVLTPLSRDHDLNANSEEDDGPAEVVSEGVLPAIAKLRKIIRAVRSSPQRRESWYAEVAHAKMKAQDASPALMLILDVRTRWTSTHQMLRRALDNREALDSFVNRHRDLRPFELLAEDWEAISMVAGWLKSFRAATTQMSATRTPMLSTTHAIFRGLQSEIRDIIRSLPNDVSPNLKKGLVDAHLKLSDYYSKFDESPFYLWSALLDPRISYMALKDEFDDDLDLSSFLEVSKAELHDYYKANYAPRTSDTPSTPADPTSSISRTSSTCSSSPQKNFMQRYQRKPRVSTDELLDFWALHQEDFETCDPLLWWRGRRAQFPNLYRLARDIFSIPGSAVAVERIFSGGRDTISLRRATLKPETIKVLMVVKKKLHLEREKAKKVLRKSK